MKLHITNTETQQSTVLDERQVKDVIRALRKRCGLNMRGETTLYIWHGRESPAPTLEYRDFHGRKGVEII